MTGYKMSPGTILSSHELVGHLRIVTHLANAHPKRGASVGLLPVAQVPHAPINVDLPSPDTHRKSVREHSGAVVSVKPGEGLPHISCDGHNAADAQFNRAIVSNGRAVVHLLSVNMMPDQRSSGGRRIVDTHEGDAPHNHTGRP